MKRNKEKQPKTFNEFVPATVISQFLGISVRRVHQLVAEKVLPRESRANYPLQECVQAYIKHLSNQGSRGPTLTDERTRLIHIQVEKKKMELEVYRGEFIPRIPAIQERVERDLEIKTAFMSLHDEVSFELVGKGLQEIQAIIKARVFSICRGLARPYKTLDAKKIKEAQEETQPQKGDDIKCQN